MSKYRNWVGLILPLTFVLVCAWSGCHYVAQATQSSMSRVTGVVQQPVAQPSGSVSSSTDQTTSEVVLPVRLPFSSKKRSVRALRNVTLKYVPMSEAEAARFNARKAIHMKGSGSGTTIALILVGVACLLILIPVLAFGVGSHATGAAD